MSYIVLFLLTFLVIIADCWNERTMPGSRISSELKVEVKMLSSQSARVSWQYSGSLPDQVVEKVEVICSPAGASYFTVYPVLSPVRTSQELDQLLLYTEYQVVVRLTMASGLSLSSSNIVFDTARLEGIPGDIQPSGRGMDNLEIGLLSFILLIWLYVIRIFLQRWEKISRHIPTLSVYSKEMAEKIEMEAEKLRSANSVDYNKTPLGRDKRTNSTLLLKQPNSLEVDRAALRKTKSEENMGSVAPKIIIDRASPGVPGPVLISRSQGRGQVSLEVPTPANTRHQVSNESWSVACPALSSSLSLGSVEAGLVCARPGPRLVKQIPLTSSED